jgi:hypothetical protein
MVNRRQRVAVEKFEGVIFVRKNSKINKLKDIHPWQAIHGCQVRPFWWRTDGVAFAA